MHLQQQRKSTFLCLISSLLQLINAIDRSAPGLIIPDEGLKLSVYTLDWTEARRRHHHWVVHILWVFSQSRMSHCSAMLSLAINVLTHVVFTRK